MKNFRILLSIVGFLMILGLVFVSRYVWLPDVISKNVAVLDSVTNRHGDHLRLVQVFVGDGYLTEFIQTDPTGRRWSIVIDGDAKKAWRGQLVRKDDNALTIHIWDRSFEYNEVTHIMTGLREAPVVAYEIPEGTPITPPR